jgi:hypothetical protein
MVRCCNHVLLLLQLLLLRRARQLLCTDVVR